MMYGKNVVKKGMFSFLLVVVLLLVFSGIASATVLRMPETYSTIQAAINAASTSDTVLVNDGTYYENINFNGKAITIRSVNGAATTTIDGGANGSVATMSGGGGEIIGFTITNGNAYYGNSGGIYAYGGTKTISNCTITGNIAEGGGGICIGSDTGNFVTISNCIITGNTASYSGGGIRAYGYYGSVTISDCAITENTVTGYGGGVCDVVYGVGCSTISNCTITGNSALLMVADCTIGNLLRQL